MRSHVTTIVQTLPVILLLLVAASSTRLVIVDGLSSWRVGTFGMFASLDNLSTRRLEAYVVKDGAREPVDLTAYEAEVEELRLWPSKRRLERFLSRLACREHRDQPEGMGVTLRYLGLEISEEGAVPVERWRGTAHGCS